MLELFSQDSTSNYEQTSIYIYPDLQEDCAKIVQEISSIKQACITRGSGQYTDSGWYYGSSLLISSTIYYSTNIYNGILYGRITSAYVKCSVVNSTVIDGISLKIGQQGFCQNVTVHRGTSIQYTYTFHNQIM